MRVVSLLFGLLAGSTIVALVGRYGYLSADNPTDAAIAAFLYATVALGAIAGPAAAAHAFRSSVLLGLTASLLTVAAILANVTNSLGAVAGRADVRLAERSRSIAQVDLAQRAVEAATAARLGECRRRGSLCREREADEREAQARLRAAILAGKPVGTADPLGAALARLLATDAAIAATAQQLAVVTLAELLVAMALLLGGMRTRAPSIPSIPTKPRTVKDGTTGPIPIEVRPVAEGRIAEWAVAALAPSPGRSVAVPSLYEPYVDWCRANRLEPVERARFEAEFNGLCQLSGFRRGPGGRRVGLEVAGPTLLPSA